MKKIGTTYMIAQLILAALIVSSCDDIFNCLDGDGIEASEYRVVPEFHGVKNTTSFDVELIHDTDSSVVVSADQNLLPYINTSVRDGVLIIETEYSRCLISYNPVRIEVHMPSLESVELTGSGNIFASDFKSDEFEFRNSGSGTIAAWNLECDELDVKNAGSGDIDLTDVFCTENADATITGSGSILLTGLADQAIYHVTGSGNIIADEFPVDICTVNIPGSGNIYCYVNQMLNIVLTGSGNVFYSGTPQINQLVTGSGNVHASQ